MTNDSDRERLPFEPNRKQKTTRKAKSSSSNQKRPPAAAPSAPEKRTSPKYTREETSIPETVSRRMQRRMIFFSGIPVLLGVLVFFASYVVVTQDIAELPNVVVLLTTLACFGLSVVGLSYGVLSASWDETTTGTLLGFDEFQINFGRLIGSWRQAREERRNKS